MTVKKRRGLSPLFAITIILLTMIICIGCSFFFLRIQKANLAKLESALPESAISAYLKQIKNNDFDKIYENSLTISPHLNSKEDYITTLKNIYGEVNLNNLTYVKKDNEENLYQIIEENKLIAELQLVNNGNKWIGNTIFKGDNNYTIQVPSDLSLQINNLNVDDSYISEKNITASNFNGLKDKSDSPKVNTYEINNLISEPSITIDGGNYSVIKDSLNGIYYVGEDATNDTALVSIVEKAATTLAKYPTKDAGFGEVSSITIKNSDFYDRISSLDNQWYAAHGTANISNLNVSKIIKQSDDSMIANVSLDFHIASSTASKTYHIGYQLTFINISGNWKIAGIATDNDLNPANGE